MSDLQSRLLHELATFAESLRNITVYDCVVVPGALLHLAAGVWMITAYSGVWSFLDVPWHAGKVGLFAFVYVEGNAITRLYFMILRRIMQDALQKRRITPKLEAARNGALPAFTHFPDLPMLFLKIHRPPSTMQDFPKSTYTWQKPGDQCSRSLPDGASGCMLVAGRALEQHLRVE